MSGNREDRKKKIRGKSLYLNIKPKGERKDFI